MKIANSCRLYQRIKTNCRIVSSHGDKKEEERRSGRDKFETKDHIYAAQKLNEFITTVFEKEDVDYGGYMPKHEFKFIAQNTQSKKMENGIKCKMGLP